MLTRRAVLESAGAICALGLDRAPARALVTAPFPMGGVNLAGAEFGTIPGTHGREYLYPPLKHFVYYRNLGFNLIRLPFKWERLQPQLYAAFSVTEQKLLTDTVRHATGGGQRLIVDPHNFAKRRVAADGWSTEHEIGSPEVPIPAFVDFWFRLATLFKDDHLVILGLMNEPVGIDVASWLHCVNMAIAAIRAAGAANLILVPGTEYSGAHSWQRLGNTAMAGLVDPLHHFAFDVHQYFDQDSSGTKSDAVSGTIGSERIEAFQNWARKHGFKAVLGEFNGGRNRTGYNALNDVCQELTANADVWLGWAAWAGGPRWPEDEMFNLEPWHDGRIREQTAILAKYAHPKSPTFWVAEGAAVDLDFARKRFYGAAEPDKASSSLLRPSGALLDLLRAHAFTLVIEMRDNGSSLPAWDLVEADGAPLLQRTTSGMIKSIGFLQTAAQPRGNWQTIRRVALSADRQSGQLSIGVTGARSVQSDIRAPSMNDVAIARVSQTGSGTIRRITGYPRFLQADALDGLLA